MSPTNSKRPNRGSRAHHAARSDDVSGLASRSSGRADVNDREKARLRSPAAAALVGAWLTLSAVWLGVSTLMGRRFPLV
jgi:hypothetical protein